MFTLVIAGALLLSPADTVDRASAIGPRDVPVGIGMTTREERAVDGLSLGFALSPADTVRPRAKAVEISEGYETRLQIHKFASYATVPLFAAQYLAGTAIWDADRSGKVRPQWATNAHRPLGYALGALFAANSVTGAMNWWETRGNEKGRTWRTIHAALMLASDAGFAVAGNLGSQARFDYSKQSAHRTWALTSMGVALASYVMMLEPLRRD
ncbi:MAG: hypothetical protein NTZ43_12605 [Gemmatimonadetes bacterium]|nr:hypothetical protein [Gemmatimonadota bacterium]